MKLHYKVYGEGPPIIILHGLFGMGDNWRNIAKLMEQECQCIVVDLRNHGRSPHDPVMNFQVMAEDIQELIFDLHFEKVNLLGHSMGGKVAMQYALNHPERVEKIIVVDITPKYYPSHHEGVIEAIQSIDPGLLLDRSSAEKALSLYLGRDQATIQFLMKNLNRRPAGGFEWKANMPGILNAYYKLMEEISLSRPFLGPALFIRGENSGYILDQDLPYIKEIFPQARLVTIAKAGHWVHADAPQVFAEEILSFLRE
jgi:pimeloyl-ACP methyl ester carboxylesterase